MLEYDYLDLNSTNINVNAECFALMELGMTPEQIANNILAFNFGLDDLYQTEQNYKKYKSNLSLDELDKQRRYIFNEKVLKNCPFLPNFSNSKLSFEAGKRKVFNYFNNIKDNNIINTNTLYTKTNDLYKYVWITNLKIDINIYERLLIYLIQNNIKHIDLFLSLFMDFIKNQMNIINTNEINTYILSINQDNNIINHNFKIKLPIDDYIQLKMYSLNNKLSLSKIFKYIIYKFIDTLK